MCTARSWTPSSEPALRACPRTPGPGRCCVLSSTMSRPIGTSRTRVFGRCAPDDDSSPIPKSWPGCASTGPFGAWNASGATARWSGGESSGPRIHDDICRRGTDPGRGCLVRAYGSRELDASLLLLPIVGFLPPDDQRIVRTVEAVQRELSDHGLLRRYRTDETGDADGLAGDEGVFLACSFWLVDALALLGRRDEAVRLFERLLALRNDVGLLSEEYDPTRDRLVGNFPQAFSHVGLVKSAFNLGAAEASAPR